MHAVLTTSIFEAQAKAAGVTEAEMSTIVNTIARNPELGALVPGTGGARKLRFAAEGRGKSGGYRTLHYLAAENIPVFLLALVSKGQRSDLSQAERNALRATLSDLAGAYRSGSRERVVRLRRG